MADTDPAFWLRLSPILDAALDLPPERRAVYLDQACAGDRRLREAADSLLAAAERTSTVLDRPVEIPSGLLRGILPEANSTRVAASPPEAVSLPPDSGAGRFLPGAVVGGR